MKNLVVSACRLDTLCGGGGSATHFSCTASDGRLLVATSHGQLLCFQGNKVEWHVELFPDMSDDLHVTALNFSLELDAVCCSLSTGALLMVHTVSRDVEEVGTVEGGILTMQWSPDGDLLAILTGTGSLLVMNQGWEALSEVALVNDLGAHGEGPACSDAAITWRGDGKFFTTSVRAGGVRSIKTWDRTTFAQHSVAEHAADLAAPLCWQPNGRHLYTALPAQEGTVGHVRLYETNGLMHGGFDLLPGSGPVCGLHWSPDSELLAVLLAPADPDAAATQAHTLTRSSSWSLQIWHRSNWHWYLKQERRYAVSPTAPGPPLVCWDEAQPSLLHILSRTWSYEQLQVQWDSCVSDRGTAVVVDGMQLLITPLKHVRIPPPMCAVRCCLPDTAVAVAVTSSTATADEHIVAVLADGRLALLRCVEDDLWEETLEEQVDAGGDTSALTPAVTDQVLPVDVLGSCCVKGITWLDATTLLLLLAVQPGPGSALLQVSVTWSAGTGSCSASVCPGALAPLSQEFRFVVADASRPGHAVLQQGSGKLFLGKRRDGTTAEQQLVALDGTSALPAACCWLAAVPSLAANAAAAAPLLGLTPAGQLFWGSALVASEVTSFVVRAGGGTAGPALLYTTRASLLYTVYFAQLLQGSYQHKELLAAEQGPEQRQQQQQPLQQHRLGSAPIQIWQGEKRDDDMRAAMHAAMKPSASNAAARDVVVRAVEQGSRLVAAPKDDVLVVLQLPRGNLETVCPRALVLAAITQALQEGRFADAWQLATVNRVDLNLIVDYQWPKVLDALSAFVQQVPEPGDLCDLLFALRPDSVVAPGGMYAFVASGSEADADVSGKVDAVCDGLRATVEALPGGSTKYLTVIATAFARKSTRQLDQALACIKATKEAALLHEQEHEASTSAAVERAADSTAEKALKHVLLHVDADELYRVALGMYDLALAYMVIANAQRDPGEYMAELQRFQAVPSERLRHHAIDMHLHRYPQAVENLFAAGPEHFGKALSLARDKGLLRLLLSLCAEDDPRRPQVLDAYGDTLDAERKHEDAAVSYLAAGQLAKALNAYRSACQWRMVFVLARRLQYSDVEVQHLAVQVSDELAASGQPAAGAAVLLHYMNDVDNAVSLLSQAREWREALHMAHCHKRQDLVDTVVAPAAASAAAGLLNDARESMERLAKYWARLKEVRGKRKALEAVVAADMQDGGTGEVDMDAMTDVNSLMTSMSMYTENTHTGNTLAASSSAGRTASTQGGRRAQPHHKKGKAKGGKIRQGSPQEEVALVEHLGKLAPTAAQLEEAGQLGELLILLGHFVDARTLQQELGKWLAQHQEVAADLAANPVPIPAGQQRQADKMAEAKAGASGMPEWKWAVLRSE